VQDTFGPIEVPADRYWGAQTQRSLMNFKIGGDDCTMPVEVIKGFGILKKCAARINIANGTLSREIGDTIIAVSDELVAGKLDDHFPLVIWRGWSPLQTWPDDRLLRCSGGVSNGLWHPDQHERERGHFQPRD
jgi:fumarate hydratase, class II